MQLWDVPRLVEQWEYYIDDEDELDYGEEEEGEEEQETRIIKVMGKLMVDLDFLETKELANGLEHFIKKEKKELEILKERIREKKEQLSAAGKLDDEID